MLTRRPSDIAPSEITPREVYLRRREFIAGAAGAGARRRPVGGTSGIAARAAPLQAAKSPLSTTDEPVTPLKDITSYNNFYEFGTDKDDPAKNAHTLKTKPWTVKIDGLVGKPADYDLEDLVKPAQLEERIYRMRCVEGWSMVIPWVGVPLAERPQARRAAGQRQVRRLRDAGAAGGDAGAARLVPAAAVALCRGPAARRGDASAHHPGRRPLRRDAAQSERRADPAGGAVEVRLQEHQVDRAHQPHRQAADDLLEASRTPSEYGFYSNVNPAVDHPRWSQATERRIGESGLFAKRRPTLPFNGYGEQVASLYAGLDLKANY